MSVRQFTNSLRIIQRNEHSNRGGALLRHLYWQGRKQLFPRPVWLRLSESTITDDEPGGVISMVNMLGRYDFNNMHFVQAVLGQHRCADAGPTGDGISEEIGRRAPVFIDVGANIGAYTLIASEVPDTVVISLEPIPAAFAKLQQNVALNNRRNVRMLNVAASRQPGQLRMTCDRASVINHVVDPNAVGADTMLVEVDTLDAICGRLGLAPSVIKIDVEGHEPEVLAGAVDCLETCDACIVENGDRMAIMDFMQSHNMVGPLYYRHRTATLQRAPQPLAEDQIYVSRCFSSKFMNIAIQPPVGLAG